MKGWATINTDAGWYPHDKVGSFAYWIRFEGHKLTGSGMLKGKIKSPTEAEKMAIANALHVLQKMHTPGLKKIIFNRDNIYAANEKRGSPAARAIHESIRILWRKYGEMQGVAFNKFFEFRHVKAHGAGADKRGWVNNWCHEQCSMRLREWNQSRKQKSK